LLETIKLNQIVVNDRIHKNRYTKDDEVITIREGDLDSKEFDCICWLFNLLNQWDIELRKHNIPAKQIKQKICDYLNIIAT